MQRRVFIGIPIQPVQHYATTLDRMASDLDIKVSITNPELYHFTAHFFGDEDESTIEKISIALESLTSHKFPLVLHKPDIIPKNAPKKTRVLYIEPSKGSTELLDLVKDIQKILRSDGFSVSKRNYLPHLTIGRVKRGRDKVKLADRWRQYTFPEREVIVDRVEFIHSELTSSGPVYHTIKEIDLKD